MKPLEKGPLSNEEIEELEQFLMQSEGMTESMDVSTLDGFLTAILCGPKTILPSEWLPWVWDLEHGDGGAGFSDQAEAQHILGLLLRHMNDIAATLSQAPEVYKPLLAENPNAGDPIPILDEWCFGFVKGISLDPSGWEPLITGKPEWLKTIFLYGTEEGLDTPAKQDLSLEQHYALAAELPDLVRKMYAHWCAQRSEKITAGELPGIIRREPIRNPNKVGRNDPCPCGSGKKYKHCHAGRGPLH
jgi:uncharacterized protein